MPMRGAETAKGLILDPGRLAACTGHGATRGARLCAAALLFPRLDDDKVPAMTARSRTLSFRNEDLKGKEGPGRLPCTSGEMPHQSELSRPASASLSETPSTTAATSGRSTPPPSCCAASPTCPSAAAAAAAAPSPSSRSGTGPAMASIAARTSSSCAWDRAERAAAFRDSAAAAAALAAAAAALDAGGHCFSLPMRREMLESRLSSGRAGSSWAPAALSSSSFLFFASTAAAAAASLAAAAASQPSGPLPLPPPPPPSALLLRAAPPAEANAPLWAAELFEGVAVGVPPCWGARQWDISSRHVQRLVLGQPGRSMLELAPDFG